MKPSWTQEDVDAARSGLDSAEACTVTVTSAHIIATVDELRSFWKEYSGEVRSRWAKLPLVERQSMVMSRCPYLPTRRGATHSSDGSDVSHISAMVPEINLEELSGNGLLDLFEEHSAENFILNLCDSGKFSEGRLLLIQLLATLADEIRQRWFGAEDVHTSKNLLAGGCGYCHQPSPKKHCSRCKFMYYCDENCQKAHWAVHKRGCTPAGIRNQEKTAK